MDVYPNTNLRLIHVDHTLGSYNARLHFGGGCGGSLVRREMADKSYLVISFLRLSENTSQRKMFPRPTPITPSYPPANSSGPELPSFASLTSTVPLGQPYYPVRTPGGGQGSFAYSPPSQFGLGRIDDVPAPYARPVTATMEYGGGGARPGSGDVRRTSPTERYQRGEHGRLEEGNSDHRDHAREHDSRR